VTTGVDAPLANRRPDPGPSLKAAVDVNAEPVTYPNMNAYAERATTRT
jgi:hypothetical protein